MQQELSQRVNQANDHSSPTYTCAATGLRNAGRDRTRRRSRGDADCRGASVDNAEGECRGRSPRAGPHCRSVAGVRDDGAGRRGGARRRIRTVRRAAMRTAERRPGAPPSRRHASLRISGRGRVAAAWTQSLFLGTHQSAALAESSSAAVRRRRSTTRSGGRTHRLIKRRLGTCAFNLALSPGK